MVEGGPRRCPSGEAEEGRPRKADLAAAAAAAAAATATTTPTAMTAIVPAVIPAAIPATTPTSAPTTATPVADGLAIVPAGNGVPAAPMPVAVTSPAAKPEPKPRKPRKKKGEVPGPLGVDGNLVGKTVTGVLDGSFDAGYLLTVRVGDSKTVLRGVVFGPGLTVPLSKSNDVAPGVKVVKRDDSMTLPASSPISVLSTPASSFPAQNYATPAAPSPTSFLAVGAPISSTTGGSVPAVVSSDSNSQVQPVYPGATATPVA